MKQKNIFTHLNFSSAEEEGLIMSKSNINKISKLFDDIFEKSGETQQVFITRTLEAEALAISTAEDSSLSPTEATNIDTTEEQSLRILKYQEKELPIDKKYEMLEYENIKSVSNQSTGIGFEDLNVNILCQLHHDLTLGLDEYGSQLQISKYHSGKLRQNNTVKVGRFPPYEPPEYKSIRKYLEALFFHYQQKEKIHLVDIIEFGILLYAIHPFQNGNKRVTRIIESALLHFYKYSAQKTISLGRAYAIDKTGFNHFLLSALKDRNTISFVNFSLRCFLAEGERNLIELVVEEARGKLKRRILAFSSDKKRNQYEKAFSIFYKHSFLKNSEFTRLMKKGGHSHTVSQGILKVMVKENIIDKINIKEEKNAFYTFANFRNIRN